MRRLIGGGILALQLAALAYVPASYADNSQQKLRTAAYELASSDIVVRSSGIGTILELVETGWKIW